MLPVEPTLFAAGAGFLVPRVSNRPGRRVTGRVTCLSRCFEWPQNESVKTLLWGRLPGSPVNEVVDDVPVGFPLSRFGLI